MKTTCRHYTRDLSPLRDGSDMVAFTVTITGEDDHLCEVTTACDRWHPQSAIVRDRRTAEDYAEASVDELAGFIMGE